MFYSIQYENGRLAASNRFYMFTQSVKFCTFYYDVSRVQMLQKCDYIKQIVKTNGYSFQQVLQQNLG